MTIFNILPSDKVTSIKLDKYVILRVTHVNCDEPFLELYIHQDMMPTVIDKLLIEKDR